MEASQFCDGRRSGPTLDSLNFRLLGMLKKVVPHERFYHDYTPKYLQNTPQQTS